LVSIILGKKYTSDHDIPRSDDTTTVDIRIVLSSIGGYMEITYAKILETMKTFSSEELNRFVSTEEYKTFIGIRKVLQENGYGYGYGY